MSNHLLLAIDAGTESLRAGVIDASGILVAYAATPYETQYPQAGWAEQDPRAWHHALITAVHTAITLAEEKLGRTARKNIVGIGFTATTCTLVALDASGNPLRPALLWMDVRAAVQAQRIYQTQHPALQYSPAGLAAEWMICKALWLHDHEPETYARTTHLIEFTDWLGYTLSGRLALNLNTITQRWHYNAQAWGWPVDLFAAVGLADLPTKFPSDILPAGAKLGGLLPAIAEAMGVPELAGVPVFEGGGDAFIGLLGINVAQPGVVGLITGSSNVIGNFITQNNFHAPGLFGAFPNAVLPGLALLEAGQASTGSILAWFKRNFARELPDQTAYKTLDAEAALLPMGAGGLIALDHFQGNRTPYTDSLSRGALWGLSLASTRAHVFRALMESIAFGTRQILDVFRQTGNAFDSIYACGGACRSQTFMQIYADICGLPITVMQMPDAALMGGAILAAVGAGLYADLPTAAQAMTAVAMTYTPDLRQHAQSDFYFEQYQLTYSRLRDLMHKPQPQSQSQLQSLS